MTQDFSKTTMAKVGYKWDDDQKVYYFCIKGSRRRIYNYDVPIEYDLTYVEEQQAEDDDQHGDAHMHDADYSGDGVWL